MEYIFKEVVQIMHNDYAGFMDKRGWDNPDKYLTQLKQLRESNNLTREKFQQVVKDYLLDFKDLHINFYDRNSLKNQSLSRGFNVRRYNENLYVTQVEHEGRLKKGMCFKSIGGITISELKEKHSRLFIDDHPERENWMPVLSLYEYGELEDNFGNASVFQFQFYEKTKYQPDYSVRKINDNTVLFTITDFMDPDRIVNLIEDNKVLLNTVEHWIIDVRINYGGSDSSFHPLLSYLMPVEGVELNNSEDRMLFNCTDHNANLVLEQLNSDLNNIQDQQAMQFLKVFIREWQKNKGKGFVEFDFVDILPKSFIKGSHNPKQVVVLTDNMCGSSGESFIEFCKKSNKVIVIGRPTMGLNDYANVVFKRWDIGFELMYPTSRLSRIDKGMGMTGKGIEPDVYIPWTPQHLDIDKDLETALDYLSGEKKISIR